MKQFLKDLFSLESVIIFGMGVIIWYEILVQLAEAVK